MQEYSNQIFNKLLKLQNLIDKLPFSEDDIRKYYFDMLKSVLLSYYNGYLSYEMNEKIINNISIQKALSLTPNQIKILNLSFSSELSMSGHLSHHHRNLIISSWSLFELLITTLSENILSSNIKKELLSFQFDEIKKKLRIEESCELRNEFSKNHLTHVPMPRKYDKLFDLIGINYSRNRKKDKNFLRFLGDFRNTMHTNFIYYGLEHKKYIFKEVEFHFTPNKLVRYNDPSLHTPALHLDIIDELIDISSEIIKTLNIENEISYPDLDAMKT